MTFTGAIGAACMYPLRAIIRTCVVLRIHPNTLTLIGVLINVGAAWALGYQHFRWAFLIMMVANIFDFIDGKVAHELQLQSQFGAFWDSTLDRFSDLALLTGLIFLSVFQHLPCRAPAPVPDWDTSGGNNLRCCAGDRNAAPQLATSPSGS